MPAHQLENIELENGWRVGRKITNPGGTGGHFSVCYEVVNKGGQRAFLKALDLSRALQSADPARELQYLTEMFNFERDVLEKCRGYKLSRVVVPIDSGAVLVNTPGASHNVQYIIFKMASGDLRSNEIQVNLVNIAWCLRAMHQTAIGLQQLHSKRICHQDLKPSNVLFYNEEGIRVSDLGTSFDGNMKSPRDAAIIAGAVAYAPHDRKYQTAAPLYDQRVSTDVYLLGSLFFFYFTLMSATTAIEAKLNKLNLKQSLTSNFENDLVYLQAAFVEAVNELEAEVMYRAPSLAGEVKNIVIELCNPDPNKRGLRREISKGGNPFDLYRIASRLDLLATKAEVQIRTK